MPKQDVPRTPSWCPRCGTHGSIKLANRTVYQRRGPAPAYNMVEHVAYEGDWECQFCHHVTEGLKTW